MEADVGQTIEGLFDLVEGDAEYNKDAAEKAMEKGLNDKQKEVLERYVGEGRTEVDSSRVPSFAEKIAARTKIPWSFKVDGVLFFVKTTIGGSINGGSEWWWEEDGYNLIFYKYNDEDRKNEFAVVIP